MFKGENQNKTIKNVETVIGPSVKVEGEFNGEGDVIVEGVVMGNLSTQHHLKVGGEARVQAEVNAGSAYIAGEVIGNITAPEGVELTSTAKIKGDIHTGSIAIEKGAQVNGKISMNGATKAGPKTETQKKQLEDLEIENN